MANQELSEPDKTSDTELADYDQETVDTSLQALGIRIDTFIANAQDTHHSEKNIGHQLAVTQRDDLTVNHVSVYRTASKDGTCKYKVIFTETKEKTPPNPHHDRSIDTPYDLEFKSVAWIIHPNGTLTSDRINPETFALLEARITELESTEEPIIDNDFEEEHHPLISSRGRLRSLGNRVLNIFKK